VRSASRGGPKICLELIRQLKAGGYKVVHVVLNKARRKGRRKDGIALDDAGIAVGRALPASLRSMSVTARPRLTSESAIEVPTIPAPSTIMSLRARTTSVTAAD
jgi:hypothetical protein